ncbi:MAG: M23 family metallopeptidase [Bacilli bacterium]|nr:M23 family metallopeptidase [Bacilli bacterium]
MKKYGKLFIPTIYICTVIVMVLCVTLIVGGIKSYLTDSEDFKHVIDNVFEKSDILPVVKTESNMIIKPYISDDVKIGRPFYNYEGDSKKQESSLIMYKDTYFQNKGVDYVSDELFDVVSILDGEVINVEENEIYGKIVTVKYNDNLVIKYSNIKDVLVNTGYKLSQGEILAVSDKAKYGNTNEFMLHLEVYFKDKLIDPESLYTLSVSELE